MTKEKRFEVIQKESKGLTCDIQILVDKATGVQYLYVQNGYGGGLTPLLAPDGQPLLWKPAVEEGWK